MALGVFIQETGVSTRDYIAHTFCIRGLPVAANQRISDFRNTFVVDTLPPSRQSVLYVHSTLPSALVLEYRVSPPCLSQNFDIFYQSNAIIVETGLAFSFGSSTN